MLTVESLKAFGANTDEGIKRCAGMENFYLNLVRRSLDDAKFDQLRSAVNAKDYEKAFEIVHSMKGVFANLSLDPVLKPIEKITDLLRNKSDADYGELLDEAEKSVRKLEALVKE